MHLCFLIFVLLTVLSASFAEDQLHKGSKEDENNNNVNNIPAMADGDDSTENGKNRDRKTPRTCKPALCSRIYKPVCVSVNGVPLTAPSMCHYKDKERCLREIYEEGEKLPVMRLLHEGVCNEADPNILNEIKKQQRPGRPNRRRRPNKQIRKY